MVQREKEKNKNGVGKKKPMFITFKMATVLKSQRLVVTQHTHHSVNSQLPKPVACEEPKRTPFYTDILQTRTQQLLQGY